MGQIKTYLDKVVYHHALRQNYMHLSFEKRRRTYLATTPLKPYVPMYLLLCSALVCKRNVTSKQVKRQVSGILRLFSNYVVVLCVVFRDVKMS